jgi:hypothetical protein
MVLTLKKFLLLDMLFLLAVTGASIAMAIAASDFEQVSSVYDTSNMYRRGSFAASAVRNFQLYFFIYV